MVSKKKLRGIIEANLNDSVKHLNAALRGENLDLLEPVLKRVGRGGVLPHWYSELKSSQTLPNLDGKTVGSVVEMLFLSVLEKIIFKDVSLSNLLVILLCIHS